MRSLLSLTVATLALAPATAFAQAQLPAGVAAPGETVILTVHAEGAQVYDCKADASGQLAWQFREPVATLIEDGKTVGRQVVSLPPVIVTSPELVS